MSDGSTTWTYTYDADGMRTKRTTGTQTYTYVYNGGQLSQMTKGTDTLRFSYDASGLPLTVTYNGTTYYYITNIQGDVIGIANQSGQLVVQYLYNAWGVHLETTGTMAATLGQLNPLRYRGYVYDQETSLYYLQSRYYDPELGRFINADGFVSTGQGLIGNNMFAYCLNNPANLVDDTGTLCRPFIKLINDGSRGTPVQVNTIGSSKDAATKVKETAWSLFRNIEASFGVGLGLLADVDVFDGAGGLSLGCAYDLVHFSLIDGEFQARQRIYSGISASILFFEKAYEEEQYRETPFHQTMGPWRDDSTSDAYTIVSISGYLFGGLTLSIGFDFASFFRDVDKIYNGW